MSVLDFEQFDLISRHIDGYIILTIGDHLEWLNEEEHILALRTKVNNYLNAIASGELVAQYPDAEGRAVRIQIVAKYKPTQIGYDFLRKARETLQPAGYGLELAGLKNGEIVIEDF